MTTTVDASTSPCARLDAGIASGAGAAGGPVSTGFPAAGATGAAHRTPHSLLRAALAAAAGHTGRIGASGPHYAAQSAVSGAVSLGWMVQPGGDAVAATTHPAGGAGAVAAAAGADRIAPFGSFGNDATATTGPLLSGRHEMAVLARLEYNSNTTTESGLISIGADVTTDIDSFETATRNSIDLAFGHGGSAAFGQNSASNSAPRSDRNSAPRSARVSREFGTGFGSPFGPLFGGPGTRRSDAYSARPAAGTDLLIRPARSALIRKEA